MARKIEFVRYVGKKLRNALIACRTRKKRFILLQICNIIVDTMLLLGGGSKTPVTFKRESFIEIAIYLKLLTIAANIPMSRCYKSPRSASNNNILFYYTKAILI